MGRRVRLQDGRLGDASLPKEPTLNAVLRQPLPRSRAFDGVCVACHAQISAPYVALSLPPTCNILRI